MKSELIACGLGFFFGCALMMFFTVPDSRLNRCHQDWLDYTVAEGKAEYYLDSNNERQWRWKEAK